MPMHLGRHAKTVEIDQLVIDFARRECPCDKCLGSGCSKCGGLGAAPSSLFGLRRRTAAIVELVRPHQGRTLARIARELTTIAEEERK